MPSLSRRPIARHSGPLAESAAADTDAADNFGVSPTIFHATGAAGCITLARALHRLKDGDIPLLIELALEAATKVNAGIKAS